LIFGYETSFLLDKYFIINILLFNINIIFWMGLRTLRR